MSQTLDKYRPLLDLIGKTEGTDKGDGYNETLGYGAYTSGNVNLVGMTLAKIDVLQTSMLGHPANKLNSSAIGRYQIVRTTLRSLKKQMSLPDTLLFNENTQDRLAVQLLRQRGIDKYISGEVTENYFINNIAKEWASLPTTDGTGHYGGQRVAVSPSEVRQVLLKVKQPPLKPLGQSRTLAGSAMTATGTAGAAVAESQISETAQTVNEGAQGLMGLASFSEIIMYLFIGLSVLGIGLTVYARLDDRKEGKV